MALTPSADSLLTAFDQVGNSNSHLLSGKAEGDARQSFARFIDSGEFQNELLVSDLFRDWWNFHEIGPQCRPVPLGIKISNQSELQYLKPLTVSEFNQALFELLDTGKSFYDRRLPLEQSQKLVESFVQDHCSADDIIVPVYPNFLFQVSKTGDQENVVPFFEGHGWDRCWVWVEGERLLVMLLNGAP